MAAGPIGSVWATGSWSDTAWEANSWADAVVRQGYSTDEWWKAYQQLRIPPPRREAEAVVYGMELRFSTGQLAAVVDVAIRHSARHELETRLGVVGAVGLRQAVGRARVRTSVLAELGLMVGRVRAEGRREPTAAEVEQALAALDVLFGDEVSDATRH